MHILDGNPGRVHQPLRSRAWRGPGDHGKHPSHWPQALFLGSTAEGVFDTLPCDVLLIKPEGFASELTGLLESGEAKAA